MIELLVVDDNPAESYLVLYALEGFSEPLNFRHARDGSEALRIVSKKKFDLIILDWNLPVISGYEVLEKCVPSQVPVVIFSSSSSETDAKRALELGAREFVHKPATLDDYRDTVIKMIERWVPNGGRPLPKQSATSN